MFTHLMRIRRTVLCMAMACVVPVMAEVVFCVGKPAGEEANNSNVSELLERKTEQILLRNSAAASPDNCEYVIVPTLIVESCKSTEGLLGNVSVITGEFTLTAKNINDGTAYYAVTVPLKVSAKSLAKGDEAISLARSIRTNDVRYTRFIRISRTRIEQNDSVSVMKRR